MENAIGTPSIIKFHVIPNHRAYTSYEIIFKEDINNLIAFGNPEAAHRYLFLN